MPSRSRPWCVTLVGWLYLIVGVVSILNGVWTAGHGVHGGNDPQSVIDLLWIIGLGLVAAGGGGFLLRGHAWARWLVVLWMAFHVALSALHDPMATLVHAIFLAVTIWGLYCSAANAYFRGQPPPASPEPPALDARPR